MNIYRTIGRDYLKGLLLDLEWEWEEDGSGIVVKDFRIHCEVAGALGSPMREMPEDTHMVLAESAMNILLYHLDREDDS